jgi:hypothetical protein
VTIWESRLLYVFAFSRYHIDYGHLSAPESLLLSVLLFAVLLLRKKGNP